MARAIPIKPRISSSTALSGQAISIVASKFNKDYVDALIESCAAELKELLPESPIHLIRVPGAFEIPVTIKHIARQETDYSCFIALGVIIQGETKHGDHLGSAVGHGLLNLSLELTTPVINEVLHVENEEQAKDRCYGSEINRGVEAARSAYGIMSLFQDLEA